MTWRAVGSFAGNATSSAAKWLSASASMPTHSSGAHDSSGSHGALASDKENPPNATVSCGLSATQNPYVDKRLILSRLVP